MALKSTFSQADIRKELEAGIRKLKAGIVLSLRQVGEESVQMARTNANEIDASGRLASSIGYLIVADGVVVASEFQALPGTPTIADTTDGEEAGQPADEAKKGESLALELAARYSKGYALIVVSGSEYAVQAESMSKDVLTGAEMYAEKTLPQLLERLRTGKV